MFLKSYPIISKKTINKSGELEKFENSFKIYKINTENIKLPTK